MSILLSFIAKFWGSKKSPSGGVCSFSPPIYFPHHCHLDFAFCIAWSCLVYRWTMTINCLILQALFNSCLTWPRQHLTPVIQASSGFTRLWMPIGHIHRNNLYFVFPYPAAALGEQLLPSSLDLGRGIYPVKPLDRCLVEVANLIEISDLSRITK